MVKKMVGQDPNQMIGTLESSGIRVGTEWLSTAPPSTTFHVAFCSYLPPRFSFLFSFRFSWASRLGMAAETSNLSSRENMKLWEK